MKTEETYLFSSFSFTKDTFVDSLERYLNKSDEHKSS